MQRRPWLFITASIFLLLLFGFLAWYYIRPSTVSERKDFIQLLTQAASGIAIFIGLLFTWRNFILTQQNTQETLRLAQEGKITERFSKAIEQLGSDKLEIRLGGIYSLERIARDSERDIQPIMEVLTTYVREKALGPDNNRIAADIQAILTVIGRRPYTRPERRIDLHSANLQGAIIPGASLNKANLIKVSLRYADLRGTRFEGAFLIGANLEGADLSGASFHTANMKKANLSKAHMPKANLKGTQLEGANLVKANLIEADLGKGYISEFENSFFFSMEGHTQCVNLIDANLSEANLEGTYLEGVNLSNANLTKANLRRANLKGANLKGACLEGADLSEAQVDWNQIKQAKIDNTTKLPSHFERESLLKSE